MNTAKLTVQVEFNPNISRERLSDILSNVLYASDVNMLAPLNEPTGETGAFQDVVNATWVAEGLIITEDEGW